ncbi:MAG: nuclear transport factor 2 family protein [Acidobacteriota bacterium]|nr:nuclear transport factor 2 family protein [Acidobacteriota bacterium]
MIKRLIITTILMLAANAVALAQNTNSSQTIRPRTTEKSSTSAVKSTNVQQPATAQPATRRTDAKPKPVVTDTPGSQDVVAAFNALINGIRRADVKAVSNVYWNSPRLVLFNNNGSVTKGWDQMRKNRESSYPDMKDVKLDVKDVSIMMLGRDGALVSCLWTQSQNYKGAPETATGRMTLVFKRIGKDWKAIHLHTSADRPDPSRVLPSEQAPTTNASPSP